MNNYYEIDEIGKMEYLSNLFCYISSNEFNVNNYSLTIRINSTNENEAKKLHPYILESLTKIEKFNRKAKEKLKELYNPTEKELKDIGLNQVNFNTNKEFNLLYNLPDDSFVEYLSIKFCKMGEIIDSGGGNY